MEVPPTRDPGVLTSTGRESYAPLPQLVQSDPDRKDFTVQYIATRKKEHRIYTNKEVAQLPAVPSSHIYFKEWQIRKKSAAMLVSYLKGKKRPLKILEVGCGNGWLSAMLAREVPGEVTGIDINGPELQQAKEVFEAANNLHFFCTTLDNGGLELHAFDVIVFAASLQYFASVQAAMEAAQLLLSTNGEIHIMDTHFYDKAGIEAAKTRTCAYYTSLGFPEMSRHYYHHSLADFSPFCFTLLFKPSPVQKLIFRNPCPFPWLKIMNSA